MNKERDLIFDSTYSNINEFISNHKDVPSLVDLCIYLGGLFTKVPPTEMQKEFIGEFFTHEAWAEFVQRTVKPDKFWKHIPPFDFVTIRAILSFETMLLVEEGMKEFKKVSKRKDKLEQEKKTLKKDLKEAISDSYEDGIFYKDNGWCNTADVLVKHKLITLKED